MVFTFLSVVRAVFNFALRKRGVWVLGGRAEHLHFVFGHFLVAFFKIEAIRVLDLVSLIWFLLVGVCIELVRFLFVTCESLILTFIIVGFEVVVVNLLVFIMVARLILMSLGTGKVAPVLFCLIFLFEIPIVLELFSRNSSVFVHYYSI
jgi:hypothetical protein